jgi:hypothetical protein
MKMATHESEHAHCDRDGTPRLAILSLSLGILTFATTAIFGQLHWAAFVSLGLFLAFAVAVRNIRWQ